jgi:hypothetical protein
MIQHPRTKLRSTAETVISTLFYELEKRHKLNTYEDLFSLVVERMEALTCGMRADKSVAEALTTACSIVPKRRPRFAAALAEWRDGLLQIQGQHELTYGEWMSIFGNDIARLSKWCIRAERHPNDPDKPGDVA